MTYMEELSEAQLLRSIWHALSRIESGLSGMSIPEVALPSLSPDFSEIVTAVTSLKPGPTATEIAEAIATVLAPGRPDTGSEALSEVAEALKKLDFRLQGMGTQTYGGGTATLDPKEAAKLAKEDTQATLAKEATLQTVRDTLFRRTDPLPTGSNLIGSVNVSAYTYTMVSAEASAPAGTTFATVVADTPATDLTLVGYNAEVTSLIEVRVRMRLITGTDEAPTVHHVETVTAGANGWQPLRLSVASGTRVAVQVVHDQISSQTVHGTLNWSNP